MKRLCSLICTLCLVFVSGLSGMTVSAAEITSIEGCFKYSVKNGEATVLKVFPVEDANYALPETLGGYPATAIGDNAYSFFDIETISIPTNIKSIDEQAFDYAQYLGKINVDAENQYYTSVDGILYDKEMKTLIRCPENYNGKIIIPDGVEKICDGAFFSCREYSYISGTNIECVVVPKSVTQMKFDASADYGHIYFGGSQEEWNQLEISNEISASEVCLNYVLGSETIITESVEADCEEGGIYRIKCAHCDYTVKESIINPLGHDYGEAFPDEGVYETQKCSCCDATRVVTRKGNFIYEIKNNTAILVKMISNFVEARIPSTVDEYPVVAIGDNAFETASSAHIIIPASVEKISEKAICDIPILNEVQVDAENQHYTSVDGALYDKEMKTLIRIPKCSGEVTIPDGVERICSFKNCGGITSLKLSESLKVIEEGAFEGCEQLESLHIPANVEELTSFDGCNALKEITVDENNSRYTAVDGILYDMQLKKMLYCPKMQEGKVVVPDGIEQLSNLSNRPNITELVLPEGFNQMLGESSFYACTSLEKICIPSTLVSGLENAFSVALNLKEIVVSPDNPVYISVDGILYDKAMKEVIQIPAGKDIVNIADGVMGIRDSALFDHKTTVEYLFIPESVTFCELVYPTISHIYFGGTQEAWEKLDISRKYNAEHYGKTVHFDVKYDEDILIHVTAEEDCENEGYNGIKCSLCDYIYKTEKTAPTGHDYGNLLFDESGYHYECEHCEHTMLPTVTFAKGDIDGDNVINSVDFVRVRAYFFGRYEFNDEQIITADVNSDGVINSTDFMQIRYHFLGLYVVGE